jgi:gamma-glutamyltranspeptidase / glutathione hydrolase
VGDVVAYTNTINFFGCSGQVVGGYGFLLNDELTDFDFAPSWSGAYDPNLPTAGKEPRSSMGPVIALRNGRPQFAIGAAGGSTIITTVVQILMNRVNFGMGLPAALAENFSLATGSILPLDNYPGDATALQMMGHGRAEAIAEPVRLGGGGALAVNPSPG